MYARVASFEGGDLDRLQELTEARRASGEFTLPDGVKRTLVLAERFEAMGDEIPEDVRGRRTSVAAYEVVFDEET
jgi:hypothetical protein